MMTDETLLIFQGELYKAIQESSQNPSRAINNLNKVFNMYGLSAVSMGAKSQGTTIVITPKDTLSQLCMATIFDNQMFESLDVDIKLEK